MILARIICLHGLLREFSTAQAKKWVWFEMWPFMPGYWETGADPGLEKGWGTPDQNGEKSKINDIHDLTINVRSKV